MRCFIQKDEINDVPCEQFEPDEVRTFLRWIGRELNVLSGQTGEA